MASSIEYFDTFCPRYSFLISISSSIVPGATVILSGGVGGQNGSLAAAADMRGSADDPKRGFLATSVCSR